MSATRSEPWGWLIIRKNGRVEKSTFMEWANDEWMKEQRENLREPGVDWYPIADSDAFMVCRGKHFNDRNDILIYYRKGVFL